MNGPRRNPGSFRDPSGHVYHYQGRVFRTLAKKAADNLEQARLGGKLDELVALGLLLPFHEVPPDLATEFLGTTGGFSVVEHPCLPFVSYPYEWCFQALKAAALHHLQLQLAALERSLTLTDATAYNIQFLGPKPVFVDLLSLRPYREGELWAGHRQFCEQFLGPLLLPAARGIFINPWYRGNQEGIPLAELVSLLPWRWRMRPTVLTHLVLPARAQRAFSATRQGAGSRRVTAQSPSPRPSPARGEGVRESADCVTEAPPGREGSVRIPHRLPRLSRQAYTNILRQLMAFIGNLGSNSQQSIWGNYADTHTYSQAEYEGKRAFVGRFIRAERPRVLWDLGCNTGDFSALALRAGAERVIGFDADASALDQAFSRAQKEQLDFLPLYMDAANPSPDQGWNQGERQGLAARANADGLLALAFVHHLAIGRNIPLDEAVGWLMGLAPRGVIEFVPRDDPTVQTMLAHRDPDLFADYTQAAFVAALQRRGRIVAEEKVSETGRHLYAYQRGT